MPLTTVGGMTLAARWTGLGAVLLIVVGLAACAPEPTPSPTPTGFASEEEAFAAAEATIDAYVNANNRIVVSEPESFEPLFALTTGEQNDYERKRLSAYHADGYTMSGTAIVVATEPDTWTDSTGTASIFACIDVSKLDVTDRSGVSQVSADRPPRQSLRVTLVASLGTFKISLIEGAEGQNACGS